ncbi:hypothetical protein [Hydrogenophaga sp.]|uniref:hypothetical protein n=1 Tax=Hydrogenophaga sp. TaxID=1904254 RepID=UPI002733A7C9|nr:hypothetical protein [Hydrogenophaga sp.]MDP1959965.1 hypothetical protein [Methylotenera sp.]MDP3887926.1 hypothetical protein [Hydrogenophaga sp.]
MRHLKFVLVQSVFLLAISNIPFAQAESAGLAENECVILVASTKSEQEARNLQKKYAGSELYTSKSGYIAVGAEKLLKSEASGRIKSLISEGKIPKDSNCADSSRLISKFNGATNVTTATNNTTTKAQSPIVINERAVNLLFCGGLLSRASGFADEDANQRTTGEAKATLTQLAKHLSTNGMNKWARASYVVFGDVDTSTFNEGVTDNKVATWFKSNQVTSIINKGMMEANRIIISQNGKLASFSIIDKGTIAYTKTMECLKLE